MKDYNILDDAEVMINQRSFEKPDFINITEGDWAVASCETKSLLMQLKRFERYLGNAYSEAVKLRDWERAFLLYERLVASPFLLSINPELYAERECRKREVEFIARAREWVAEVKELWQLLQDNCTAYYEKGQYRTDKPI